MRRTVTSIFLIALMGFVMNPLISFAQEEELLLAINDDESLSDQERFEKAKGGLEKALSLAQEKVAELSTDLNDRRFEEETRETELKVLFLEDLTGYDLYYSETLEVAQTLEDLESVQALAQEVKDYRDTIYTPGVEKVVEFILVFYTEDVINTATERFERISADVEKLEALGLIETGMFSEQMDLISTLLVNAADLRLQAKDMILAIDSETSTTTDEAILEVSTTTEDVAEVDETVIEEEVEDAVDGEEVVEKEITPKMLLETSLNNVKRVYELFIEISSSVRETLGLE